jgi:ribosomal-protein-alanine N-acetyltransferase
MRLRERARPGSDGPVVIRSARCDLVPMTPAFLDACLAGDRARATTLLGLRIPDAWWDEAWLMRRRRDDLHVDPTAQPFLLRAIGLRAAGLMVGHVGFHGPPGMPHLATTAPGGLELGYTVFPPFRRRGLAREAVQALVAWASAAHGVERFVVSIAPANLASLRLAAQLGFRRVGTHVDPDDGPEDVFVLARAAR